MDLITFDDVASKIDGFFDACSNTENAQ